MFFSGSVAAAITTPIDVAKTLLNTQQHKVIGMRAALRTVYRLSGKAGFFKGVIARTVFQFPGTGICWSTYELIKHYLKNSPGEVKWFETSLSPTVLVSDRAPASKLSQELMMFVVPYATLEPKSAKSNETMYMKDRKDVYDIPVSVAEETAGNLWHEEERPRRSEKPKRTSECASLVSGTTGVIGAVTFSTLHRTEDPHS